MANGSRGKIWDVSVALVPVSVKNSSRRIRNPLFDSRHNFIDVTDTFATTTSPQKEYVGSRACACAYACMHLRLRACICMYVCACVCVSTRVREEPYRDDGNINLFRVLT